MDYTCVGLDRFNCTVSWCMIFILAEYIFLNFDIWKPKQCTPFIAHRMKCLLYTSILKYPYCFVFSTNFLKNLTCSLNFHNTLHTFFIFLGKKFAFDCPTFSTIDKLILNPFQNHLNITENPKKTYVYTDKYIYHTLTNWNRSFKTVRIIMILV